MFIRKLILCIKRKLFIRLTGINPEDVKKLVYVQKYIDMHERKMKSYADYVKSELNKKKVNENKYNN